MTTRRIDPERPDAFDESSLIATHASAFVDHAQLENVRCVGDTAAPVHARSLAVRESILEGAALAGARLPAMRCLDTRFERADASASTWTDARLVRVRMNECKLTGLDIRSGELRDVQFKQCKAPDLLLSDASLSRVRFDDCRLDGLDLSGARIESCAIHNCDARNLRLAGARIELLDLRGSLIDGITLDQASLSGIVIDPTQAIAIAAALSARVCEIDEDA